MPIDFNTQQLPEELDKAGYRLAEKTLFTWEGVTQYISAEASGDTFTYISQAAPGSKAVFTYMIKSFTSGNFIPAGLEKFHKLSCRKTNSIWIHGFEQARLADYLSKYSLSLVEDLGSEEMLEQYITPKQIDLSVFEIERIAFAEVKEYSG